jgi:hypothetical protein
LDCRVGVATLNSRNFDSNGLSGDGLNLTAALAAAPVKEDDVIAHRQAP